MANATQPSTTSSAMTGGSNLLQDPTQRTPLIMLAVITAGIVYSYWNMLTLTASFWDQGLYSHGWLIPAFAVALMWLRFQPFREVPAMDRWIGLGILLAGIAMRIGGSWIYSNPVDRLSMIVVLFGAFVVVGGWQVVRWAGPAIGFLVFMYPLPSVLERRLLLKLQEFAAIASTFIFQMLGFTATRSGYTINMPDVVHGQLEVADACSGLRMTTIFIALSVAIVLLVERPWWDKLVILVSSIPVALFVNIVRIIVTGLLFMTPLGESETAKGWIHDIAGYVMPIMAMGLMWLELWVMSHLMVADDGRKVAAGIGGRRSGAAPIPR